MDVRNMPQDVLYNFTLENENGVSGGPGDDGKYLIFLGKNQEVVLVTVEMYTYTEK